MLDFLFDSTTLSSALRLAVPLIFAAIGGYFAGATANEPMGGAILFALIAGLACIVYAIDNQGK